MNNEYAKVPGLEEYNPNYDFDELINQSLKGNENQISINIYGELNDKYHFKAHTVNGQIHVDEIYNKNGQRVFFLI